MHRGILLERVGQRHLVGRVARGGLELAVQPDEITGGRVGNYPAGRAGDAALVPAPKLDDEAAGAAVERPGDALESDVVADERGRVGGIAAGVNEQQPGGRRSDEVSCV